MLKRLITYLLLLVATVCYGVEQSNVQGYGSLVNMPIEQLMEKGRIHFGDHNPDSALVCFSIVANRYNKSQRSQDRENAALVLNDLACIYQYFYFDYQEAHHNYMKALELCDEGGYEKAKAITSLNLANLLSLYSKGFESKPVSNQARELYHQSLEGAYKTSNWELYATAFIDYADNYTDIKLKDYSHLFSRNIPDTIQNLKYARYYYRALENIQKGNYAQARQWLNQQLEATNAKWLPERYVLQAYLHLAKTHELEHDYPKAVQVLRRAEQLAAGKDVVDYEIAVCEKLAEYYKRMGDSRLSEDYKIRHLEMKDSLHNAMSLASIGEMNFVHELQQEEAKVRTLTERGQIYVTKGKKFICM